MMNAWIALIAASVAAWGLRAGPALLGPRLTLPSVFERAGRFASPALLGALAASQIWRQASGEHGVVVLVAAAAAVVTAAHTRSVVAITTVGCGAAALALLIA